MSVMYVKVAKKHPETKLVKYYAQVKTIKMVRAKEVASLLADETTLNKMEAAFALEQLEKIVIRLLLQSYSVQLGDWASFYLTNSSEASDTKESCNATSIKQLNVRCRLSKEFYQDLRREAEYQLVTKLEVNEGDGM